MALATAVAVVTQRRGQDLVYLFDDVAEARAFLAAAANRGIKKSALKTNVATGDPAILSVNSANLTP
jgi:hypothetical protein